MMATPGSPFSRDPTDSPGGDHADGSGAATVHRINQSEALLMELYHDELNPRFRLPPLRMLKVAAIMTFAAFLVFMGSLFFKFNSFIFLKEDTFSKKGNLESAIQRRSNLFNNLTTLTLSYADLEHSIFSYTAQKRTELGKSLDTPTPVDESLKTGPKVVSPAGKSGSPPGNALAKAFEEFSGGGAEAALGRLLAVVEQYPTIRSADTYRQMMSSLVEIEDLIATRRTEYNMSIRSYNTAISKFPWHILAHLTNFERFDYFEAITADKAAPVLTPRAYRQLIPSNTAGSGEK